MAYGGAHGRGSRQRSCWPPSGSGSKQISPRRGAGAPEEGDERREPGDFDSEGLYQDELDSGIAESLKRRLEEVERAEERLAAGTYGLSVRSGEPIPDKRLLAEPCAELTVEEAEGA